MKCCVEIRYWSSNMPPRNTLNSTLVVCPDVFLCGQLSTVRCGHDAGEGIGSAVYRIADRSGYRVRIAKLMEQVDGFCLALLDISDQLPDFRCSGRDFQRRVHQIGASKAAQTRFLGHIHPAPEPLELFRREQNPVILETQTEDRIRLQGFAGFGTIGDAGVKREKRQARFFVEFTPLVGIHQIACDGLGNPGRSSRKDIQDAVDDIDARPGSTDVFHLTLADESVLPAGEPRAAKREIEIAIDLLEQEFVAERVLVQIERPSCSRLKGSHRCCFPSTSARSRVLLPVCSVLS